MAFEKKSVFVTLSTFLVCLIVSIILALGLVSYYVTNGVVQENSSNYVEQLVENVERNIQYYIENVKVIKHNITYDQDLQSYLQGDPSINTDNLQTYLNNFVTARGDIANIFIVTSDGRILANQDFNLNTTILPTEEEWYQKAIEKEGLVVSTSRVQNIIKGQYPWVISFSSPLIDHSTGEAKGVLLIDLNFKFIEDLCSDIKLGKKGYLFILDKEGDIVYHPKQQLIYSNLYREPIQELIKGGDENQQLKAFKEGKHYSINTIEEVGWKVIGAVYVEDLIAYGPRLRNYFIYSAMVAILIAVILALSITGQILHPLKELTEAMIQMKRGDYSIQIQEGSKNEFAKLSHTFNSLARKTDSLIKEIHYEQNLKRKNELKALQAQINPHFLYNTLDSIIWMAELQDHVSVKKMTSALAKLFRISISKGRQIISIEEELEHVKNYLQIQKMRYSNKLDYTLDIKEEVLVYQTVKLILQPIVENAIYHGIKNKRGIGHVGVYGEIEGDVIVLRVEDNGAGMTEEMVDQLLKKGLQRKSQGVGVTNVDERIKLYFGEHYGIHVESQLGEGTKISIHIPKVLPGDVYEVDGRCEDESA